MITYLRKRLIGLLVVLTGVTILSFLLSSFTSVDPAEALARRSLLNPTPEQIEELRWKMGLHLPIHQQYFHWLGNVVKGDLGISLLTKNAVSSDIAQKLPETLKLAGMALVWIISLTLPISVISAVRQNRLFDHVVRGITILGISIPNFWMGFLLLLVFAIAVPVFKVIDYGNMKSLILPSVVLAIPVAATFIRLFRATILSNLNKDYVVYAKARGISTKRIIGVHVLRNSLPPMVTLFCQYLGLMVAGSAVVESVFSIQGIGMHLVHAILSRDLPTVHGCVLVIAFIFVIGRALADIVNCLLDPRMVDRGEVPL
ncbi:ABC transporter permease [Paenibacillus ehimensis]|uniref:ABC transporter permease n=1 Tax=Paenibacillus ehimensis TaxID=79264 RepID=UPI003D2904DB